LAWKKKKVFDQWAQTSPSDVNGNPKIGTLGSGSDFTYFQQHLGISSFDFSYGSKDGAYGGVYHSKYDSYYWMKKFCDKDFLFHKSAAEVMGVLAIWLVDMDIIPFNYSEYSRYLKDYLHNIELAVPGNYTNELNFTLLYQRLDNFIAVADAVSHEIVNTYSSTSYDMSKIRRLNDRLMQTERAFIWEAGIKGREYYRHLIFAPGKYDSYFGEAFPTLADAILDLDWDYGRFQIKLLSQVVDSAALILSGTF